MNDEPESRVFRYALGAAVAVAWLACITTQIVSHNVFQTPFAVHGLMGTVVGAVFGDIALQRSRRRGGGDG